MKVLYFIFYYEVNGISPDNGLAKVDATAWSVATTRPRRTFVPWFHNLPHSCFSAPLARGNLTFLLPWPAVPFYFSSLALRYPYISPLLPRSTLILLLPCPHGTLSFHYPRYTAPFAWMDRPTHFPHVRTSPLGPVKLSSVRARVYSIQRII